MCIKRSDLATNAPHTPALHRSLSWLLKARTQKEKCKFNHHKDDAVTWTPSLEEVQLCIARRSIYCEEDSTSTSVRTLLSFNRTLYDNKVWHRIEVKLETNANSDNDVTRIESQQRGHKQWRRVYTARVDVSTACLGALSTQLFSKPTTTWHLSSLSVCLSVSTLAYSIEVHEEIWEGAEGGDVHKAEQDLYNQAK